MQMRSNETHSMDSRALSNNGHRNYRKSGTRMSDAEVPLVRAVAAETEGPKWMPSGSSRSLMGASRPVPVSQNVNGRLSDMRGNSVTQQRSIFEGGVGAGAPTNQIRMQGQAPSPSMPPTPQMPMSPRPSPPPAYQLTWKQRQQLAQAAPSSSSNMTAFAVLAGVVVLAAGIFLLAE